MKDVSNREDRVKAMRVRATKSIYVRERNEWGQ